LLIILAQVNTLIFVYDWRRQCGMGVDYNPNHREFNADHWKILYRKSHGVCNQRDNIWGKCAVSYEIDKGNHVQFSLSPRVISSATPWNLLPFFFFSNLYGCFCLIENIMKTFLSFCWPWGLHWHFLIICRKH
jgi:hypothetical protein